MAQVYLHITMHMATKITTVTIDGKLASIEQVFIFKYLARY